MKKKLMIFVVMSVIAFSGCSATSIDVKEKDLKLVSEYAAGLLLKYDKNYDSRLDDETVRPTTVPDEEVPTVTVKPSIQPTKGPEQKPVQSKQPDKNHSDKQWKKVTLTEIWNQKGIEVTYKRTVLQKEYPKHSKNNYVILEGEKGKLYCIVEFQLKNVLKQRQVINSTNNQINYTLESEKNFYHASLTMLVDDIHFWEAKLEPGETKSAIAVFVVPDQINLNKTELKVTRGNEAASVLIK